MARRRLHDTSSPTPHAGAIGLFRHAVQLAAQTRKLRIVPRELGVVRGSASSRWAPYQDHCCAVGALLLIDAGGADGASSQEHAARLLRERGGVARACGAWVRGFIFGFDGRTLEPVASDDPDAYREGWATGEALLRELAEFGLVEPARQPVAG